MMTPVSGWLKLFCSAIYIHKRSTTTGEWPQLSIPFINQAMSCPYPSWRKRYALAKNNSGGNSMSTLATAQRFCAHRPVPQSLLHVAKQSRHEFTALAYECGYYDQAHLTNEVKLFAGYTPREYITVCTLLRLFFLLSPFFQVNKTQNSKSKNHKKPC